MSAFEVTNRQPNGVACHLHFVDVQLHQISVSFGFCRLSDRGLVLIPALLCRGR